MMGKEALFRYKVIVEYDGSFFHGWQRQEDQVFTVQGTLEEALAKITGNFSLVEGAGRTDAGVHATGQVAHFDLNRPFSSHRLQDGLNFYLRRKGVSVLSVIETLPPFHARFSALSRTYRYHMLNRRAPSVLENFRAWHVIPFLDSESMHAAAQQLTGYQDFSAFRASECQSKSPWKTLSQFDVERKGERIIATIKARSFLHNQVRIMMGTLRLVGEGRLSSLEVRKILESRERRKAGPTAPAHGLFLTHVDY